MSSAGTHLLDDLRLVLFEQLRVHLVNERRDIVHVSAVVLQDHLASHRRKRIHKNGILGRVRAVQEVVQDLVQHRAAKRSVVLDPREHLLKQLHRVLHVAHLDVHERTAVRELAAEQLILGNGQVGREPRVGGHEQLERRRKHAHVKRGRGEGQRKACALARHRLRERVADGRHEHLVAVDRDGRAVRAHVVRARQRAEQVDVARFGKRVAHARRARDVVKHPPLQPPDVLVLAAHLDPVDHVVLRQVAHVPARPPDRVQRYQHRDARKHLDDADDLLLCQAPELAQELLGHEDPGRDVHKQKHALAVQGREQLEGDCERAPAVEVALRQVLHALFVVHLVLQQQQQRVWLLRVSRLAGVATRHALASLSHLEALV